MNRRIGYDGEEKGVASFVRQELGLPSRQAGKRWVNRAEFLLCCDAMVMPRRMGEGESERRKEKGGGVQGVRIWGHAGRRIRGPRITDATLAEQSLGCSLLTVRLFAAWLKTVSLASQGPSPGSKFGHGSRTDAPLSDQQGMCEAFS